MRFVVLALVAASVIGLAVGGRFAGLSTLRIRWAPLAVLGLAMQLLAPASHGWPYALLLLSFIPLLVFAIVNVKTAGFTLILAGTLMNLVVIAANHGMPVTYDALRASGQQGELTYLIEHGGAKHHLAGAGDHLTFLADVIPIPPPVTQVVSAGDIVAYAGVGYALVVAMRKARRGPHREPGDEPDRGAELGRSGGG